MSAQASEATQGPESRRLFNEWSSAADATSWARSDYRDALRALREARAKLRAAENAEKAADAAYMAQDYTS